MKGEITTAFILAGLTVLLVGSLVGSRLSKLALPPEEGEPQPTPTSIPQCHSGDCITDCLCRGNTPTECRLFCPKATVEPPADTATPYPPVTTPIITPVPAIPITTPVGPQQISLTFKPEDTGVSAKARVMFDPDRAFLIEAKLCNGQDGPCINPRECYRQFRLGGDPRVKNMSPTFNCTFKRDGDGNPFNPKAEYFAGCNLIELSADGKPVRQYSSCDAWGVSVSGPTKTITYRIPDAPTICPTLEGNGGFHVVVIPEGYTSLEDFRADAQIAIEQIKSTNLGSLLNKFSFLLYPILSESDDCQINGTFIGCNHEQIFTKQQLCDGHATLVIVNNANQFAASAELGVCPAKVTKNALRQRSAGYFAAHELSHCIGLNDEYDFKKIYKSDPFSGIPLYENCSEKPDPPVPATTVCPKWADKPYASDLGCFEGCTYSFWNRSQDKSIMEQGGAGKFNEVSLEKWAQFLSKYH